MDARWPVENTQNTENIPKNTRHSYLDLLNNLKFDESDPILGSNKVEQAVFLLLLMMIMRNLINVLTAVSMNWLGTGYCTLLLPFLWMNVDWLELAH